MSVSRFVAVFLTAFAVLVATGGALGFPRGYALALRCAAGIAGPVVGGWWIEERPGPQGTEVWLRRSTHEVRFALSLDKFALGFYPLLSLLLATPGLSRRRLAARVVGTATALFLLDLAVVLTYPWLVVPGALADIAGFFLGLLTFVGGPVILWFAATFGELQHVWKLSGPVAGREAGADGGCSSAWG